MSLDDLPSYWEPGPDAERVERVPVFSEPIPRRRLLQGMVALGTGLGFGVVRLFPAARTAFADNSPYTWHPDPYGQYCAPGGIMSRKSTAERCDYGCHGPVCGGWTDWGPCCDGAGWHRTDWPYAPAFKGHRV